MKIFTTQERTVVIILASLFMFGIAVKVTKEHYNTGTDQITLIGSNADVVNFYAGLDEDDIESSFPEKYHFLLGQKGHAPFQ